MGKGGRWRERGDVGEGGGGRERDWGGEVRRWREREAVERGGGRWCRERELSAGG